MPKRKDLNGIPHNITMSFFGTEYYYNGGYMADWLANAALKLSLKSVSLDVLSGLFKPETINIRPLLINAARLKLIIDKELKENGFASNFITEAKIDFEFPHDNSRVIRCYPFMIDREGRKYQPSCIVDQALEPEFDPFDENRIYPLGRTGNFYN